MWPMQCDVQFGLISPDDMRDYGKSHLDDLVRGLFSLQTTDDLSHDVYPVANDNQQPIWDYLDFFHFWPQNWLGMLPCISCRDSSHLLTYSNVGYECMIGGISQHIDLCCF